MIDFSIVIPAYNSLTLFSRALESVRRQKGVTMQIIIVDDTDKNSDIEQYVSSLQAPAPAHASQRENADSSPAILYRHNTPPLGAVPNWNSGLNQAEGSFVMLLHHDEELTADDILLKAKQQFETGCDAVVLNLQVHRADGDQYRLAPDSCKRLFIAYPSLLFVANIIGPTAVLIFRRACLCLLDPRTHWFVDVEWYYRMLKDRSVRYIPDAIIASHHGHKGQITANIDPVEEAKKDARILSDKYRSNKAVRFAMWLFIHVIHNNALLRRFRRTTPTANHK